MKFLHTADWHLGRNIRTRSRDNEHHDALRQVLTYAKHERVDCVLVAGDLFDTAAPPPEAERLAYDFFSELHGAGIPAVVLAGNHDHPRRIDAVAPLLRALNVHAVGRPSAPEQGGLYELESRDGQERAQIAVLPWVTEREAIDFAVLAQPPTASISQYAHRLQEAMNSLARPFAPDAVNLLMSHLFVDEAEVGVGGGERPLSVAMGIYGVPRQMLPMGPQYIALGHVHKPQAVRRSPPAWYSGSLLQLDFGERRQEKLVNLIEAHAGQPAEVVSLPIAGRPLVDVGSAAQGVRLEDLGAHRDAVGNAWLRVFVDVAAPVANLPAVVREVLPNAVHVERVKPEVGRAAQPVSLTALGPEELFRSFYDSDLGPGRLPTAETLRLFRELLDEEMRGDTVH
ncbi:MAG: exonuclease SbcCD subunit D [Chloroflexi bacterium]|nr:exonuclease SbcCD subunit D [Chloroflexota bacterium]